MLKQRIITALVIIPPLLAAFFLLPPIGVTVLFGIVVGIGAWEWGRLCKWSNAMRSAYVAVILAIGALVLIAAQSNIFVAYVVLGVATAAWILVPFELARPTGGVLASKPGRVVVGIAILVPAWLALSVLHAIDDGRPLLLLFIIVLVAIADTAAYATGHAFGRTKLAPAISPGKTIEGVGGGVVAALVLAYLCGVAVFNLDSSRIGWWVVLAAVAGVVSVLGDLLESKMKRLAGMKDSGTILPGHGGILDRIDALTAAAPVFALGILYLYARNV